MYFFLFIKTAAVVLDESLEKEKNHCCYYKNKISFLPGGPAGRWGWIMPAGGWWGSGGGMLNVNGDLYCGWAAKKFEDGWILFIVCVFTRGGNRWGGGEPGGGGGGGRLSSSSSSMSSSSFCAVNDAEVVLSDFRITFT